MNQGRIAYTSELKPSAHELTQNKDEKNEHIIREHVTFCCNVCNYADNLG